MDLEYDQKFEEMKKYIPFLESMIKRLENSNNGGTNPRKAQLDKIRSLRDLLLDKKKRMKMDNLLKCEQVLVNLYAKVEQSAMDGKDCIEEQTKKEKSNLNIVRNKLKCVASKLQDDPDTLPEIARATNTEVICTPGSKEPALFQRRPNKASFSPPRKMSSSRSEDNPSSSMRNYTRVLLSPEPKKKDWIKNEAANTEKPLFSRRSPRRSPRRYSPSYKKERKKSSRQRSKSSQQSKDLNITLNVPEESLGSLNTKDILSRIINCSDSDVDIDTLRGLRSQILGELKQTGAKDDISDLILKSYKNKEKKKSRSKKNVEVEEGEISDSESEAIENIYGSLVVVNKDENNSNTNKLSSDKKQPRKIQICLVINADKETISSKKLNTTLDVTDFEAYTEEQLSTSDKVVEKGVQDKMKIQKDEKEKHTPGEEIKNINMLKAVEESHKTPDTDATKIESNEKIGISEHILKSPNEKQSQNDKFKLNFYQPSPEKINKNEELIGKVSTSILSKKDTETVKKTTAKQEDIAKNIKKNIETNNEIATKVHIENNAQIPEVNSTSQMQKDVVSEIDILQALKNEILGETVPISEATTPPLHQPKITKVANTQEITAKKRISIEKYKQKSLPAVNTPLFQSIKHRKQSKDENSKKQSLKLTEKECERFNFPVNVSPVDSSDDSLDLEFLTGNAAPKSSEQKEEESSLDFEFLSGSSGPKSPDHEDFADTGIKPPVIIPSDPVKNIVPSTKADVDMRTLIPSEFPLDKSKKCMISPTVNYEKAVDPSKGEKSSNEKTQNFIPDFRKRTESNMANNSPNPHVTNTERMSRHGVSYPNMSPRITPNSNIPPLIPVPGGPTSNVNPNIVPNMNQVMTPILNSNIPLLMTPIMTPNMTPSRNPNMTPSRMAPSVNPMMTPILTPNARSYEMTPRSNFDTDDFATQKHVYAPIFPTFESHDYSDKDNHNMQRIHWETNEPSKWDDRNQRKRNDRYTGNTYKQFDNPQMRVDCPSTPNPSFGRMECPSTPNPSFGRMECPSTPIPSFGRMECPSTPNPSFGRMECPSTPIPSFGRMECPSTPNPSFGRMDCPSTPNPSFGRMECPSTPIPSFGRMECPSTPNPSFGRMECPSTPNPSFGRLECPPTPNPSFSRMETHMTPVHSFGRSDCPMVPSHPFGRSETSIPPSNVFGRNDYHHNTSGYNQKYVKSQDPRLNRGSDYDKYQGRSEDRNRSRFKSDQNISTDSSNNSNQTKSFDHGNRNDKDRMPHRESSVGRTLLRREYETNESKSYNDQYRREKTRGFDDGSSRRNYRARSVGRTSQSERSYSPSSDRGVRSAGKRENSLEKPISVQSDTGRSFNIDTSFNRTFQETKQFSHIKSFDARRQRASSVGRALTRENSNNTPMNNNAKVNFDFPNRGKATDFRRACSVGRDLKDYNGHKNFKDVKADLRSSKFDNYNDRRHNRDRKSETRIDFSSEKARSREYQSNRDANLSHSNVPSRSNEYQSNRDPRRRPRESDSKIENKDYGSKYSPRNNFRDPRMRRDKDDKINNKDKYKDRNLSSSRKHYGIVYSNDNIAKGTILASAAGVKNFKIPKIKRLVEEEQAEIKHKAKGETFLKNEKDGDNRHTGQVKKTENKERKADITSIDNHCDKEKVKDSIENVDKPKCKEDLISKKVDKAKGQDNDSVNVVSENCDRRITRSALKDAKQSNALSPMKKLRRIKKPLVYDSDSDSDSQGKQSCDDKDKQGIKANVLPIGVTVNQIKLKDLDQDKIENTSNEIQNQDLNHLESSTSVDENQSVIGNQEESSVNINNEKTASVIRNELCEEQNDSLDISFGVDDELFSDNMASGSVLDNINALIADLDHDIEAPKINDFNDKFINNLVGNISSNSESPIPLAENEPDLPTDILLNNKDGLAVDTSSHIPNIIDVKVDSKINNYTQNSGQSQCKKVEEKQNETDLTISTKYCNDTVSQVKAQDNFNNDAIVSTTESDGKSDELLKVSGNMLVNAHASDSFIIPDSTINSTLNNIIECNKDVQESFPDSTNELTFEMNSDITSTHVSAEVISKEQSDTNSSCADELPRIDSIGKFLSILEDKNKIKELLTMLGKDSGENEKIKKKLEKLSEIVSDDEDNAHVEIKDKNDDKKVIEEKEINHDVASQLSQSTFDQSHIQNKKHDQNIKLGESKISLEKTSHSENVALDTMDINNKEITLGKKDTSDDFKPKEILVEDLPVNEILMKNVQVQKEQECVNKNNKNLLENKSLENTDRLVKRHETVENQDENTLQNLTEEVSPGTENKKVANEVSNLQTKATKKMVKKSKFTRKGKRVNKLSVNKEKCTKKAGNDLTRLAPKKPSRELLKLQEDIREMFISEDILNATGIRMCRLAKMVDGKNSKIDSQPNEVVEPEPIVVLENIKRKIAPDDHSNSLEKLSKKKGLKVKPNAKIDSTEESESREKPKQKPGPKSKTKRNDDDPYNFDTDSIAESNNTVDSSRDHNTDSDSDSVSTKSFGSSELLVDLKKKSRRKRRGWKLGVIKKKNIKNKPAKHIEPALREVTHETALATKDNLLPMKIPDFNCFTDKAYCFHKNVKNYLCRLCGYSGNDIVPHYKKHHPHSEIPLSRLNPVTAKEAIEQCENMNLQAISKIETSKYICRFCFKEFNRQNTALETFFWHVVSVHTGEYKQLCSECINVTRCPFHLDIPPPPKNLKGQLIGYICGRCNFTQVSLENLKTHVIVRHDDEQTEVYSINLADISRKILKSLIRKVNETSTEGPRVLRSTRSNQSFTEPSDDQSDKTESTDRISVSETAKDNTFQESNVHLTPKPCKNNIQSKFIFENDDMSDTSNYSKNDDIIKAGIKLERDDNIKDSQQYDAVEQVQEVQPNPELAPEEQLVDNIVKEPVPNEPTPSNGVLDYPHFKIKLSSTGSKEYVCCINGVDSHYKTTLLISLKKHVQMKHSENWDGYCYVCKLIVTSQGLHKFKDCLQHFLDKHIDNFPVLEEISEPIENDITSVDNSMSIKDSPINKPYINVRPLSELISSEKIQMQEDSSVPNIQIQSVVSLGAADPDPVSSEPQKSLITYNYEQAQSEIMSKKHRVVLETMLSPDKLIQIFKCAGRFCSYSTDNAEEALVHASTHQRIGGENALKCTYCDFDCAGNVIDLVTHVFKNYSHCSFSCSKCFYRAAVSQLVHAHIKRVHTELNAEKVPVLSSTQSSIKDNSEIDMLSRDEAVLHYVCNNPDLEEGVTCQFKSFVLTKFREHLQTKHSNDQEYSCYMCNISTPSSKLLAQHLKSHGLRIYQCCRCLFGADNEAELLAHASEKHPLKQPKAYLRIITSKGGNSEIRVLPLAVLSKSSVQTTPVTPSVDKESPVKQAERSIDLEKLIGHTNFMIESMSTITNAATIELTNASVSDEVQLESEERGPDVGDAGADRGSTSPAILTLLKEQSQGDTSKTLTPVQKVDPDATPEKQDTPSAGAPPSDPDVVCLDSDDDSSRQNIIDLSGEDLTPAEPSAAKESGDGASVKVPRACLYACGNCSYISKSEGMFKRHMLMCYTNRSVPMKCAHCSYVTAVCTEMLDHYNTSHVANSVQFVCALCDGTFASIGNAKKHMKQMHKKISVVVKMRHTAGGLVQQVVDVEPAPERPAPKRKLSAEVAKSSEPPAKMKKYGPQDVDKLPINPILDELVYCSLCEFSTKVRLNMVRHLQLHAEQQPAPRTAPVNPVPHLESNEKHFDKMLNLAASSIVTRAERSAKDAPAAATPLSPEAAAGYPKYVPDRHRYTCGAAGCSYISSNESMFKIHWETLHYGTNAYHCVHCPPRQHLDTSKPLTAVRIIAHLKMHDARLYACGSCTFYHYTRKMVEKHLREVHAGKLVIVREEGAAPPSASVPAVPAVPAAPAAGPAPTMDLKPWQCGLCEFKSMLRPEVIEHCGRCHQSKMQFKCQYCGFRTSNMENISKHQSKQHPGMKEEVFYFYYREGSIPDEADGSPRWRRQSQKGEPGEIKTEVDPPEVAPAPPEPPVNLDIVKREVVEADAGAGTAESTDELCQAFGQFCEPNGLKYKCPLCKAVSDDSRDAMQSHLYEELQYRKWGCAVCSYKAFHKPGLQLHVQAEHNSRDARDPIALQVDARVEAWVARLLEHQAAAIERNKDNLAKQKAEILRANPNQARAVETPSVESGAAGGTGGGGGGGRPPVTMAELERLFGKFGAPSNLNYSCPKCNTQARAEAVMQEHLEGELNRIRWFCNVCNDSFQTYHEAQFHCRSVHAGQSSRPVEAPRDVTLRAAWVAAVLRVQKLSMNFMPVTDPPGADPPPPPDSTDNSLLVVRYEENVPTPEEQMRLNRKSDSDDDRLVIDEPDDKKTADSLHCIYCSATFRYERFHELHILKHYGLKPFTCTYCPHLDYRKQMTLHIKTSHPDRAIVYQNTQIPKTPLIIDHLKYAYNKPSNDEEAKIICLVCEVAMTREVSQNHSHDNMKPHFGMKGSVVYRCCICMTLHKTSGNLKLHNKRFHPGKVPNTAFYKLQDETRTLWCNLCNVKFNMLAECRAHHEAKHGLKANASFQSCETDSVIEIDDDDVAGAKRKADEGNAPPPPPKRVARKSTTKLPNTVAVARKSTTKLPFDAPCDPEDYSYYGTKPSMDNLENVTTLMPFCNTFVPFSLKKLNDIIKIYPLVQVKDINKN